MLYIILHIINHNFCISYFKCHLKITILYWIRGFFFPKVLIYFMFPRKSKSKTHSHNMLELNVYIRWEILCKFNLSFFSHMITITFYLNKMRNLDISQSWSNVQPEKKILNPINVVVLVECPILFLNIIKESWIGFTWRLHCQIKHFKQFSSYF